MIVVIWKRVDFFDFFFECGGGEGAVEGELFCERLSLRSILNYSGVDSNRGDGSGDTEGLLIDLYQPLDPCLLYPEWLQPTAASVWLATSKAECLCHGCQLCLYVVSC